MSQIQVESEVDGIHLNSDDRINIMKDVTLIIKNSNVEEDHQEINWDELVEEYKSN
jgi:hypothetical protein